MQNTRPASFGRRGGPVSRPRPASQGAAVDPVIASESGKDLRLIARELMATSGGEEAEVKGRDDGRVPWSWRAAILAGLATAFIQVGYLMIDAKGVSDKLGAVPGVGAGTAAAVTPALLMLSVFGTGRAVATTIFIAHSTLRQFGLNDLVSYSVGGGIVAGAFAIVMQNLGFAGPSHGLMAEVIGGLSAGFFYRMFAGARAA